MASDNQCIKPMDLRRLSIEQQNAIDLLVTGSSDREDGEEGEEW